MLSRSASAAATAAAAAATATAGCPTYWPPAMLNAIIDYLYIRDWEAGKKTLVFLVKRLLVGIPTAAIADNKSEQIAKMQPHVTT
jgi:hypothetical protein